MLKKLVLGVLFLGCLLGGNFSVFAEVPEGTSRTNQEQKSTHTQSQNIKNNSEDTENGNNILKSNFTIKLEEIAVSKPSAPSNLTTNQKANFYLGNFIQKMMVILGSLSMLIIVVGAGYMIMYHGQEEFLSKGKSIVVAGMMSLVIALSSYLLVAFVRWALYAAQ